ncbi:glycosyltransferase [Alteromonas sp. ALT199]|uniref:glycosyltransferase n=1 Tax=unclassified Alteromonas TaxID=2614992 RepID=UPI002036A4A4|nr:glycosyltransferase [Alteromonas sp. ALT199]
MIGQSSLETLLERKRKFGSLGALDFLIELEKKRSNKKPEESFLDFEPTKEDEMLLERFVAEKTSSGDFPKKPNIKAIMKLADTLAYHIGYGAAIAYASKYLPENKAYLKHVLFASKAIIEEKESDWLFHVNRYLLHFELTPIYLKEGKNLFDRLASSPNRKVKNGPLISIIMPAFNAEKTLKMAARSILNQTWRNLELLIVDDCSTDKTYDAMKALAKSDSRVKIFQNAENVGPYVSKNIALSQSKGAWITGHDADDWAHPERLERQIQYCLNNKVPACLSGMMRMDAIGRFIRLNKVGGFVYDGATRSGLISLMVRKQFFDDVVGYWDNVRVGGDSELIRRIEKVQGKPIAQLRDLTMLCYDNPLGLTNHPTLGYSETGGVSPKRVAYKDSFTSFHSTLSKLNSRYHFLGNDRAFDAPKDLLNSKQTLFSLLEAYEESGIKFDLNKKVDVALVTDLTFSGGNASSTIDEINFFLNQNLSVVLIHCPRDTAVGNSLSNKYEILKDHIVNWTKIGKIEADTLICRHPSVIVSNSFRALLPKISSKTTHIVKNNSNFRANGEKVYDMGELFENALNIKTDNIELCPISNFMRGELEDFIKESGSALQLSKINWTPTFNADEYYLKPKPRLKKPFKIGRHGRDGREKWIEDSHALLSVYPQDNSYEIRILGGAHNAAASLNGKLPKNWKVSEFGAITPKEYLEDLDVFVYFPHSQLIEAFGRTVIEAIIAGIPVILPHQFEDTFGELAFYCSPIQVKELIEILSTSSDLERVDFLADAQRVALENFSSSTIGSRVGRGKTQERPANQGGLSKASLEFRRKILKIIG